MASDGGDFARSMSIATSGLRAQAGRMRVIAENLANADSTAATAGGDPYRRKVPVFAPQMVDRGGQGVAVTQGAADQSDLRIEYAPRRPRADAQGYIQPPNLQPLIQAL